MKRKLILLTLIAVVAAQLRAVDFRNGKFYYEYREDIPSEAQVVSGDSGYKGDVVIPTTGTDKGKTVPVTAIGTWAFWGSTMTSLTLHASINFIGEEPFSSCPDFKQFIVDPANQHFTAIDGVLFTKDEKTLLAFPAAKATEYVVPESVDSIGASAFSGCENLKKVVIPASVKKLSDYAFAGCSSLNEIVLLSAEIPFAAESAFNGVSKAACRLVVPAELVEAYKADIAWKDFNIEAKAD